MYDRLRAWFETFDADPYTMGVVGALVDAAETLWQAEPAIGEPMAGEVKEALDSLESALHDEELVR